jgi:hypothetical protein
MKLLRFGLLPVLLVTALLAGAATTVGASGAPDGRPDDTTNFVGQTAPTDPAAVCATLTAATTSTEALPELCRLYTGGTLPPAAQTVLGRVILKLAAKHSVKVPPPPFDVTLACQKLPADTDAASAAAIFCQALKANGTPAAACTALLAQPTLLPRLKAVCEQIKAGKTPNLKGIVEARKVAKPTKPKGDRDNNNNHNGEHRKAKPTPTATATATASPTPSPTPSGG